jgi:DNA replication ATP-dependent helicase Dna2
MYALSKRVISQYIRTGCRRRLRLDLYRSGEARREAGAPPKDTARPGLRLLTEQGRQFEREKFGELMEIFGSHVISGEQRAFQPGEECVFAPINLRDHISNIQPNGFLLQIWPEPPLRLCGRKPTLNSRRAPQDTTVDMPCQPAYTRAQHSSGW